MSLQLTAHPFARQPLRLPRNYYQQLVGSLGEVVSLELDLPEGADSPAEVDWNQLAAGCLCSVSISRGKKVESEREKQAQRVVRKYAATRAAAVKLVSQLEGRQM